jgi:hypothetical protein
MDYVSLEGEERKTSLHVLLSEQPQQLISQTNLFPTFYEEERAIVLNDHRLSSLDDV